MINKKILIIAPYPIKKTENGGQKRAKALFEMYKKYFISARYIGVFHRGHYPDWGEDDLPLSDPEIIARVDEYPYAAEIIGGEAINNDIHIRSYMAKVLMEYKPDIVHIEQPFAYLGLKPLLQELQLRPLIVFGSQNIEYPLKERIFKELNAPVTESKAWIDKTKRLEYDLSKEADLVIAVNLEDAETHKEMGAKKCIIASNGIDKVEVPKLEADYWKSYKSKNKAKHILTFIGSGHPPNWEGFLKMIGDDTTFLPKNAKIVIAGGVSDFFKNEFGGTDKNFWSGVDAVGRLEEERLAGLLESSDLLLLPITTKRGSNLKTAEALLAGKKIVATSSTFHGFEKYARLPNIYVGNTKAKYQKAILKAIDSEYVELSVDQKKLVERVQWKYTLEPVRGEIEKIIAKNLFKKKVRKFITKVRIK